MCAWCKLSVHVVRHAQIAVMRRLQTPHATYLVKQSVFWVIARTLAWRWFLKKGLMKDSGVFTDADKLLMPPTILCIGGITVGRSTSSICLQRHHASIALAGCNLSAFTSAFACIQELLSF